VYLYLENGRITKATVTSLGCEQETRDELTDTRGVVGFADPGTAEIPVYSVISSMVPQMQPDAEKPVENAYVRGMIAEFEELCAKSEYLNVMVREIVHAHYLIPCTVGEKDPERGSMISFPSLLSRENEKRFVLPVFTDAGALGRWTSLFQDAPQGRTTTAIGFPDVLKITGGGEEVKDAGYDGAVINPFGPQSLYLPMSLLNDIFRSPAYQSEYVRGENTVSMKEHRDEPGRQNQMLVGKPEENNETKLIRGELKKYCSLHKEVNRVWFLEKITPDEEKAYFIIVDVEEAQMREAFEGIYGAIRAYAGSVSGVDFARYEKVRESLGEVLAENEPV
jgi:hypothetical protein